MSGAKTVQYRYQDTIIDTVYDFDGAHPIPVKDAVVTLKGKLHKIINVNFTSGAKGEIPVFDVVAEEMN